MHKSGQKDFMVFMSSVIIRLRNMERMGTLHVYQSTQNRIADFMGDRSLSFEEINPLWLQAFQAYLLGRGLNWNTISTYMRVIRAVYYRAVDEGEAPFQPRLFRGVYTGTRVNVKRALSERTLRSLQAPISSSPDLDYTRCLFLLLFMLRGIPFVDIAYMRRCDLKESKLTYRRRKTGTWMNVHIEPEAERLIARLQSKNPDSFYLFPFVTAEGEEGYRQYGNALRRFNYQLKKLSRMVSGCPSLSSYSARHSWATVANYRNFQPELISNAMGHSSVKVTETYFMKHSDEKIDEMNRSILTYLFV